MPAYTVRLPSLDRRFCVNRYLGSHPNIVSLEDLFVSEHYDELYIVMELLDSDLHRIIQSPQALGDAHHRYFMFQLLKGVKVRSIRRQWRRFFFGMKVVDVFG